MTIRIIKGTINDDEVVFMANTSQDVIEDLNDDEAQRLINLGYAEKIDDLPKPPLEIFTESSEKIKSKITELEEKLDIALSERNALLDSDLQDVAGVTRKIEVVNSRVSSLQALAERQRAKLARAEKHEAVEAEKIAVKKMTETAKGHRKEAERILNDLSAAIGIIEQRVTELWDLRDAVNNSFVAAGGRHLESPLLASLTVPHEWTKEYLKEMQKTARDLLGELNARASQTPEKLRKNLNAKHFKSESELTKELQEYNRNKSPVSTAEKLEAHSRDWEICNNHVTMGSEGPIRLPC